MLELNHVNCLSVGFLLCHMSTSLKSVFILLLESEMLDVLPPDLSVILSMQLKSPMINRAFGKKYSFISVKKRFHSVAFVSA